MPKLPAGIRKVWNWLFAFMYLIGLPAGFAFISHTGIAGYFFALFLLLFFGQAWSIYLAVRSRFWPTTQGKVVSSRVARYLDSETAGAYWYDPKISYRYWLDGRETVNALLISSRQGSPCQRPTPLPSEQSQVCVGLLTANTLRCPNPSVREG